MIASPICSNLCVITLFITTSQVGVGVGCVEDMGHHQNYKSLDSVTVADFEAQGIPSELHEKLTQIVGNYGSATPQTWHHISKQILTPNLPFSFHQMMYYGCYKDFGPNPPAWLPDPLDPLLFPLL